MTGHQVVFEFAYKLVSMLAVEAFGTMIERRHQQKDMTTCRNPLLGEAQKF